MPSYAYTAHTRTGAKQRGNINAETRQAAQQMLQQRGLTADKIVEQGGKAKNLRLNKRVKSKELLIFTRQLSTIVSSGLPLLQGLDILAEQTEDPNFGVIVDSVAQDVESGETFSDALRRFPRAFPDLYVSMVRSGEASGDLDGVLMQLADYLEASEDLKRRIRSAMTYPIVAFSIIILIAIGLITFVVPQFSQIFSELGGELPVPTMILITASDFFRTWYAIPTMALIIVGLIFLLRIYSSTESGRFNIDSAKLRVPIFGGLQRKVAISRVTRTLSTLTRSGVNILQALEIVERTAGNEVFARAIRNAGNSVRNGESLADPLTRSEVFPAMVTRMISVGEKTGALETMLMKISDFYDSEVRATVDQLTSLLEPILIVMMGIVVGSIVVALFMPILKLSQLVT